MGWHSFLPTVINSDCYFAASRSHYRQVGPGTPIDMLIEEHSPSLFDRLPDEVISLIFTIGCETRVGRGVGSVFLHTYRRTLYEFAELVGLTCRRFYVITRAESNSHFYYMAVDLGTMTVDLAKTISTLYESLRSSKGCDIHLYVRIFDDQYGAVNTRLLLHTFNRVKRYARQLASISVRASTDNQALIAWFLSWIGTSEPYPRLQSLEVSSDPISGAFDQVETLGDLHLYERFSYDLEMLSEMRLQSLAYLELGGQFGSAPETLWFPIFCSSKYLETLCLYPQSFDTTGAAYDQSVISYILTSCRTLKNLEVPLRNYIVATESTPTPNSSNLTRLQIITDTTSLHTLFTICLFPRLREGSIFVLPNTIPGRADNRNQFCVHIDLPSLRTLNFLDSSSDDLRFMDYCKAPSLEKLTIRSSSAWASLKEDRNVNLFPCLLIVGLGPQLSIEDQLRPLNLISVEELTICVCEEHEQSETSSIASGGGPQAYYIKGNVPFDLASVEKSSRFTAPVSSGATPATPGGSFQQTPRRYALPRVRSITLYGIGPLTDALWWLERHFILPSNFTLTIDTHYIVDLIYSPSVDAGDSMTLEFELSERFRLRTLEMPSRTSWYLTSGFRLYNAIGEAFQSVLPNSEVIQSYFGCTGPATKAITGDEYASQLFSELKSLRLAVTHPVLEFHWINEESNILRAIGNVDDDDGHLETPLPRLESLTVAANMTKTVSMQRATTNLWRK